MRWSLTIAPLAAALAFSAPAFATDMMTGHHACASGGKKGGCVAHHSMEHYTGHHACASGGKKGGCVIHHPMGHHATPSGDKKSGDMK